MTGPFDYSPEVSQSSELVIPEPGQMLPREFAKAVAAELARTEEPSVVDEVRRRLAALETYVRGKEAKTEVQTAARWAEVRVGELLGAADAGQRTDLEPSTALEGSLTHNERYWFRRLAAHRAVVTDAIDNGKVSRAAVLNEISRRLLVDEPPEAPREPGSYSAIVIDPPWPMDKIERHERPRQDEQIDYPTMTLPDIGALPVDELAAEDAHLYLWVTHRFLPDGLALARQWGFRYQGLMTWRKNVGITPFSWMYDTEHVVFATRGNLPVQRKGLRLSFDALVQGHSVKPDVFYERVTEASPGPRLEMFARRERGGFEAWGNEVADAV